MQAVTDGEFRRAFWNYDFLGNLDGVEAYLGERKIKFQGAQPKPMMLRVVGKLGSYTPHPMVEHFKFVKAHSRAMAENDHPIAVVAAFPLRPRCGAGSDLSVHGRILSRPRRDLPPRRRAPSRMRAAAISSSTRSISPISAIRSCARSVANRGEDPQSAPAHLCRYDQRGAFPICRADMTTAMHLCRGNFPLDLCCLGRLRAGGGNPFQ